MPSQIILLMRRTPSDPLWSAPSALARRLHSVQAEKRRQKLVKGKALKQKAGSPRLLPALPLDEEPEKELAPVARNSICWGTFMATSCNARYQLLNGLEERYLVSRNLRVPHSQHCGLSYSTADVIMRAIVESNLPLVSLL